MDWFGWDNLNQKAMVLTINEKGGSGFDFPLNQSNDTSDRDDGMTSL